MVLTFVAVLPTDSAALNLKKKQVPKINYSEWIALQNFPSVEDDITQFYPETEIISEDEDAPGDTIAIVRGTIKLKNMNARQAFLASMVYATEHFNKDEEEGFESIDYNNLEHVIILKTTIGSNASEEKFTRNIMFKAADGALNFVVYDIDCKFREKGLIPRTLRLENMHPDTNTRHSQLLLDFVSTNSEYIHNLAEYIESRKDITSPNFNVLKNSGNVVPGMNADEVTILLGPPMSKRQSGERERWIYNNEFVVIFENSAVSKVVK